MAKVLDLPDLGVTLTINADGSVSIALGWFGTKTVTPDEAQQVLAFFQANLPKEPA